MAAAPDPAAAVPPAPDPGSLSRPWTHAYPPGVPPSYPFPDVAVTRFLADAVRDVPELPALITHERSLDHVELDGYVARLASALAARGTDAGDRVLLALPSGHSAVIALLAVWRLGAVAVPVDVVARAARVAALAEHARPAAVIATRRVCRGLADHDALPPLAIDVAGDGWLDAPRRETQLSRFRRRERRDADAQALPDAGPLHTELVRLLAARLPDAARELPDAPPSASPALLAYDDAAATPRAAVLTHANLVAAAFQSRLWIPDVQAGQERLLIDQPLHRVEALTFGVLLGLLSAASVIVHTDRDAAALPRAIERHRPSLLATTAARIGELHAGRELARRDVTSLRVVLATGGAPFGQAAAELERRAGGARVRTVFGAQEAAGLTHAQPVYGRIVPDAIGPPVTDTLAAVVDPDDHEVVTPLGAAGRLVVRGPQVCAGYWHDDAAELARLPGGWLVTDDIATLDADGVFRRLGHVDDVAWRGDTVVSLAQVEAVLRGHASVDDAAVVTDPSTGAISAVVVARRRRTLTVDELMTYCRSHLDATAVPDRVDVVDELPRQPSEGST